MGQLEQENQFMITRLTTKARKQGIWNIADYLRSDLISELDLGMSGLLEGVKLLANLDYTHGANIYKESAF